MIQPDKHTNAAPAPLDNATEAELDEILKKLFDDGVNWSGSEGPDDWWPDQQILKAKQRLRRLLIKQGVEGRGPEFQLIRPPKSKNPSPSKGLKKLTKNWGKHFDRGSGFTHSKSGNCPCLEPGAKEDWL